MIKVELSTIIDFLNESKIDFEIVKGHEEFDQEYALASIKRIIPFGLYYLEKEYISKVDSISTSIIITNQEKKLIGESSNIFLLVKNPQVVFYKICQLVEPPKEIGIHPTAIIDVNAKLGKNIYIGPYSVIGNCTIEENCFIDAHVVVGDHVLIQKNTTIQPNSFIGATGVAWIWNENNERIIQPQFGGVTIGENCFIGSDVSIVKGSVNEDTMIGNECLIAHGSKIGHGSILEEKCHLANNVSLAGNAKIGKRSFLGSACVISSLVTIGEDTIVGAGAVVTKSFPENNLLLTGVPAKARENVSDGKKLNGIPTKSK